jgi:hypothetical protein
MVLRTDNAAFAYALRDIAYQLASDLLRDGSFKDTGEYNYYRDLYCMIRPFVSTNALPPASVFPCNVRNDIGLLDSAFSEKLVKLKHGSGKGMLALRGPDGKPSETYRGHFMDLFEGNDTVADVANRIGNDEYFPLRIAQSKLLDRLSLPKLIFSLRP